MSTLAKIFGEPFTKPGYNMEDFLDHSYGTMLDAELARKSKKPPVINYEPPQLTEESSGLVVRLWSFE